MRVLWLNCAEDMAQQPRALVALTEGLNSDLNITSTSNSKSRGWVTIWWTLGHLLVDSVGTALTCVQTSPYTYYTHIETHTHT